MDIEKLITRISHKRDEKGNLEIEFEFKEDQSPEELKTIKDFILSLKD